MKIDPASIIEIRFRGDGINALIVTSQSSVPMTATEAEIIALEWRAYLSEKK